MPDNCYAFLCHRFCKWRQGQQKASYQRMSQGLSENRGMRENC